MREYPNNITMVYESDDEMNGKFTMADKEVSTAKRRSLK